MPIVVNTNAAATTAAFNLSKNQANLSKSLARLSSGNRITQPAEDAGGLAVAYKIDSSMKRTEAVLNNHQNALSFLQVQDGALESVGKIVSRMAELRTMAADVTKNASDIENYSKEFRELQTQLNQVQLQKFNGVSIFTSNDVIDPGRGRPYTTEEKEFEYVNPDGSVSIKSYNARGLQLLTHPSGQSDDGSISINGVNLQFLLTLDDNVTGSANNYLISGTAGASDAVGYNLGSFQQLGSNADNTALEVDGGMFQDISKISIYQFTHIIEKIADARAENGAEQQRIQQSYELQSTNLVNLEAAHGRIMDVDVALESTRFAKHNVLVQASASMTAQANQLTQVALTLLQ
jgi:flagellin-like hook-associated protein FlgL